MASVTLQGTEFHTNGDLPAVGSSAPDFGLVDGQREAIAGVVSETVRSWDAVETSSRIEAAIGRDLQFIRVNGTLVGGLVGVLIHAYTLL